MKFKKKEGQSINVSVLFRRGNKIIMGGNTETKSIGETEGKVMQRLSHPGIHPIYRHQIQTTIADAKNAC